MSVIFDFIFLMIDCICYDFVGLKMLCVLEVFDYVVCCFEYGELFVFEVIDIFLFEEFILCENSCIKMVLCMGRFVIIKMFVGFDFIFQFLFDWDCILILVQFGFVDCYEVVYFFGLLGMGKSYFVIVFGVEVVKVGKSVYFIMFVDFIVLFVRLEWEGRLQECICFFCRFSLFIVDEIGYLLVVYGGGNLFFQFVNVCYECGVMILMLNCGFVEWGDVFGDFVVVMVLFDRLFYYVVVVQIEGFSYWLWQYVEFMLEYVCFKVFIVFLVFVFF